MNFFFIGSTLEEVVLLDLSIQQFEFWKFRRLCIFGGVHQVLISDSLRWTNQFNLLLPVRFSPVLGLDGFTVDWFSKVLEVCLFEFLD